MNGTLYGHPVALFAVMALVKQIVKELSIYHGAGFFSGNRDGGRKQQ